MNTLLVDVGQTSTQTRKDHSLNRGSIRTFRGLDGSGAVLEQVVQIVASALSPGEIIEQVAIGCSGLDDVTGAAEILRSALAERHVTRVIIAHDSVTSTLGAIGESRGVVLAIGTGIVTLGVGPLSTARVDGWGSILDDGGSAYWIGHAGVQAALRHADGRGRETDLLAHVVAEFGPLNQISGAIQQLATRAATIARFATVVTRIAEGGDLVALAICDGAIKEWLASARAAAARSGLATPDGDRILLSWSGAVLTESTFLQTRLRCASLHEFELRTPLGTPLDGVARLASPGVDSPFHLLIDDSSSNRETRS